MGYADQCESQERSADDAKKIKELEQWAEQLIANTTAGKDEYSEGVSFGVISTANAVLSILKGKKIK